MKRSARLLLSGAIMTAVVAAAVLAAIIAAPGRAGAQDAERISSYDARIVIQHDGSILVTE